MSDDEKLIEFIKKYPVLYDISSNRYMDNSFKNGIWKKIGEELNLDGVACKSRWNNIRDTYRKSLKRNATKGAQGAKKIKKYKYSELLGFLKKFSFEDGESISNVESEEDTTNTMIETSFLHVQEEDDSRPMKHATNHTPRRKVIKTENEPTPARKWNARMEISKNETLQSQHTVDTFLASIAATLKTFSPYHLHLAKAEIFNTAQKYEYETIMGHQGINRMINSHFLSPSTSSSTPYPSNEVMQNADNNNEEEQEN